MVATIQVLGGTASGMAKYYTSRTATQYYAAERTGMWWGDAAVSLALPATVESKDLQHLLLGMTPGGDHLVDSRRSSKGATNRAKSQRQAKRKEGIESQVAKSDGPPQSNTDKTNVVSLATSSRCPGYDVTFSAPKSVSVLWAVADGETRKAIEESVVAAARESLATLRETVPLARRGRGGIDWIFAEWTSAMFLHTLSRDLEPQLHVHNVIPNICRGVDGRWAAINSRLLHSWTPTMGRVFRCQLAAELTKRLGLNLYRPRSADGTRESWFEIVGVPTTLSDKWSSRRKAIESHIDDKGQPIDIRSAKAREAANLATRRSKPVKPDMATLQAEWRADALAHGLNQSLVELMVSNVPSQLVGDPYPAMLRQALDKLSEQNSHFTAREVVQQVCEDMQHMGIPGREIVRRIQRDLEQSQEIVPLEAKPQEKRYTTKETWQREEKLLDDVRALKDKPGAQLTDKKAEQALDRDKLLSSEQRAAAKYLLCENSSIRVLSGVAGAGKSRTLDVVREGFERQGYRVVGGALAGAAKEELSRQAHVDSRTVASYLYHLEKPAAEKLRDRLVHDAKQFVRALLDKPTYAPTEVKFDHRTVLVLDEAGMLDTRSLERLIHHVRESGATLILAGDWKQLPPILAGAPMERIVKEVGSARLDENRRQLDPEDRKAVEHLRRGEITQALQKYAERNRVVLGADSKDTLEKLTTAWAENGGTRRPADHMIFTQTRAEAREANRLCQEHVLKSLRAVPLLTVQHGDSKYHIGDRIMFEQSFRAQGVENGYRGTVIAVNPILKQIKVKLDQEPSAEARALGASRFVTIPLRKLPEDAISLGYAATTHKLQGQTVDHAYLLMSGEMASREMAYVQATRAKKTTRIFVDESVAGVEMKDLIKAMERSKAKDLAHDHVPVPPPPPPPPPPAPQQVKSHGISR